MKNKGFTLIEILAVITVLGILIIIIVPNVSSLLNDSEDNLYKEQINNFVQASKQYMILHSEYLPPEDSSTIVNIGDLLYEGIIDNDSVINPKTKEPLTGCVYVSYSDTFKQYEYTYLAECGFLYQAYNFSYTGGEQEFVAQWGGKYKIEVWGAQGGSHNNTYIGGYGGYSVGTVNLGKDTKLYINVGGAGTDAMYGNAGGYNGGGGREAVDSSDSYLGSGGGASHVALNSGILSSFDLNSNGVADSGEIDNILIVAGGGGGSYYYNSDYYGYGGNAGGYIGGVSYTYRDGETFESVPATQTTGYAFGQGNSGGIYHSGGGGGFYGGLHTSNNSGGGSGYIGNESLTDKAMYCYGCAESNADATKTISTTGTSSLRDATNCSSGVSSDPVSKCAKSGNGHVKITYLGV